MWKKLLLTEITFAMLIGAARVSAVTINNPLNVSSFPELIQALTNGLLPLASLLAGVALMFAGFRFITAAASGDAKKLQEAKSMFWWVVVGTAVIVGASALAEAVVNFARGL